MDGADAMLEAYTDEQIELMIDFMERGREMVDRELTKLNPSGT